MRKTLLMLMLVLPPAFAAEVAQYVCTIGGVYENKGGKLVQWPNDKGIGKHIYVNADTGEVTGYFGTDGWKVTKIRRPDGDGILTIESASGVVGDAADRLWVSAAEETSKKHPFVYTKNWLIISGLCSTVLRRK